jgi:hypothetical protein
MRTVFLEITYDNDIDHSTVEALADAMQDGEGVVMVSVRQTTGPVIRIPVAVEGGGGPEDADD